MATTIGLALALMLVIEGILPLIAPSIWRDVFRRVIELKDGQIRFFGLASMAAGLALFWLIG
jgi:uncharacterized protein YjeT (DUF2065 family)